MTTFARTVLVLVTGVLCAGCTAAPASPARTARPSGQEGHVAAGDGVRLFYRIAGAGGDTVVVLHGGPGLSMDYLAPDLEPLAAGHVLVFYDQRGSGRSTLVADLVSLDAQRFVDDLEAVRRHFGLDRMTLLGHSWGAGLAALYGMRYPRRVRRLLLVNPGGITHALDAETFVIADGRRDSVTRDRLRELEAAYLADPDDPAVCREYYDVFLAVVFADTAAQLRSHGDFCAGSPAALRNKVESVDRFTIASLGEWDWRSALREVTAPALVVHGPADAAPLENAREWTTALPNARLLVLDGTGHFSYLEAPERFFTAAETFLGGEWPAGAEVVGAGPAFDRSEIVLAWETYARDPVAGADVRHRFPRNSGEPGGDTHNHPGRRVR